MLSMIGVKADALGILTMYLDKKSYEEAGLMGKPYGSKGRLSVKTRWGRLLFLSQ